MTTAQLAQRRKQLETAHLIFDDGQKDANLPTDIFKSWQRSQICVEKSIEHAPVQNSEHTSILHQIPPEALADIKILSEENRLAAAITDIYGNIIWSNASKTMQARAERANFIAGSCWSEQAVGTSAFSEVIQRQTATSVFSAEHFAPFIHDWSCYAAPIFHPMSRIIIGILDFSTVWNQHSDLILYAAQHYAQHLSEQIGLLQGSNLMFNMCVALPHVMLNQKILHLAPRQVEILAILAAHPNGLNIETLHWHVYGESAVSYSTLKAELSHIRQVLGESSIGSRPYRLTLPYLTDISELQNAIQNKQYEMILNTFQALPFPRSTAPYLRALRQSVHDAIKTALVECRNHYVLDAFKQKHLDS